MSCPTLSCTRSSVDLRPGSALLAGLLAALTVLAALTPCLRAQTDHEIEVLQQEADSIVEVLQAEAERIVEAAREEESAAEGAVVREIIIDDSGIILREGEDEFGVDGLEERLPVDVNVQVHRKPYRTSEEDEHVSFGKDVVIEDGEIVHNDMVILFGDIDIHGKLVGDMFVFNGDVNLHESAEVTGDILCVGGEVISDPGAIVVGKVETHSSRFLDWTGDDFGIDLGDDFYHPVFHFGDSILNLVAMLVLAWVGLLILATRLPNLSFSLKQRPWYSLLVGVLSLFALFLLLIPVALVFLLLVLTLVGIPVVILGILAIGGIGLLCWLVPMYTLSRYTFESRGLNRFLSVSIWTGLFWLVHTLGKVLGLFGAGAPILILTILVMIVGLGALVLTRLGARRLATS